MKNFKGQQFLIEHIESIFGFYHPKCIDNEGGFFHQYLTDGTLVAEDTRHLVNSTRFVINYARVSRLTKNKSLLKHCQHGTDFIESTHRLGDTNYAWEMKSGQPVTDIDYSYGWVFVVLMYSECIMSGLHEYQPALESVIQRMDQKYWDEEHQLYSNESDYAGVIDTYRGQNPNMHACEAFISAYLATHKLEYLDRAYQIAYTVNTKLLAPDTELIWEHYTKDWEIDWFYNKDKPDDMFKPWGFQTGHQTEWAKLLLILYQHKPEEWMITRAEHLFNAGIKWGSDKEFGGLVYGFGPEGEVCDSDKHFWVHCESFAAAAYLAQVTKNEKYWDDYSSLWQYSWDHLIDHDYGAWHHKLSRQGEHYSLLKSPLGKCGYHTIGACHDILNALKIN